MRELFGAPSSHGNWGFGKCHGGGLRSHMENGNSGYGVLMVLGSPVCTGNAEGAREMPWRILPPCETIPVEKLPRSLCGKAKSAREFLGNSRNSSPQTAPLPQHSEVLHRALLCSLQPRSLPDFGERGKVWQERHSSTTMGSSGEPQHLLLGLGHHVPRWDPKNRRSHTNH